jgi:cytochrome c oxidase subunit 4
MAEHVPAAKRYYAVFVALIVLTLLTVGISFLELGEWHTAAGLIIAILKAGLVALFFMHLLYSKNLTWIVVGGALFWLGIMLALTLADYLTRHSWAY